MKMGKVTNLSSLSVAREFVTYPTNQQAFGRPRLSLAPRLSEYLMIRQVLRMSSEFVISKGSKRRKRGVGTGHSVLGVPRMGRVFGVAVLQSSGAGAVCVISEGFGNGGRMVRLPHKATRSQVNERNHRVAGLQ